MNKEQLEKMFDEKFKLKQERYNIYLHEDFNDIKQFIFETIIVEVLKSVINIKNIEYNANRLDIGGVKDSIVCVKQKAKEQFGIDL